MSHETEVARQQASAGVDILDQPECADQRTRRRDEKGDPEPAVVSERRQVGDVETNWVALASDEPPTHAVQVGRSGHLR